jgi:hypothetical protein
MYRDDLLFLFAEGSDIKQGRIEEQRLKSTSQQATSWRTLEQANVDQMYVDSGVGKHFSYAFDNSDLISNSMDTPSDNFNDLPVQVGSNGNTVWGGSSDAPIASGTSTAAEYSFGAEALEDIGHLSQSQQQIFSELAVKYEADMDIKGEKSSQFGSDLAKFETPDLHAPPKIELESDILDQADLKESLLRDLMPPSVSKTEDFDNTSSKKQESTPRSDDDDRPAFADYPCATAEAMTMYQHITANIYKGSATGKSIAEESMPCECKYEPNIDHPGAACGDDDICINRMMFMECMEDDCPCGRYCRNRRFQLQQYSSVDVIRTEKKGYGLRALADLEW